MKKDMRVRGRVRVEFNRLSYVIELREGGLEVRRLRHKKIYKVSIHDIIDLAEGQMHLDLWKNGEGPMQGLAVKKEEAV